MLKSYEAIYDHGRIQWLSEPPKSERFKILVVVEHPESLVDEQAAEMLLAETSGAFGKRSLAEVTEMIEAKRELDWEEH
jgi:hypothetical protein